MYELKVGMQHRVKNLKEYVLYFEYKHNGWSTQGSGRIHPRINMLEKESTSRPSKAHFIPSFGFVGRLIQCGMRLVPTNTSLLPKLTAQEDKNPMDRKKPYYGY